MVSTVQTVSFGELLDANDAEIEKRRKDAERLKVALTPMSMKVFPDDETLDRLDELMDRVEALLERFEGKSADA